METKIPGYLSRPATLKEPVDKDLLRQRVEQTIQRLTSMPIPVNRNVSNTPAFVVHLADVPIVPVKIYAPSFESRVVTRFDNEGVEGSTGNRLSQQLAFSVGKDFAVGDYLAHMSKLSGEVGSYRNEARVYTADSAMLDKALRADFDTTAGQTSSSFELVLKTKEGDTIFVEISKGRGDPESVSLAGFDSVAVSFSVDGDLSGKEQQGLDGFMQSIGETSDGFFTGTGEQLNDLSFVDRDVFSSFKLDLQTFNFNGEVSDFVRYDFQVDDINQIQTLNAETSGYQFEISVGLDNPFDVGSLEDNLYFQKYIALIVDAGERFDTRQSDIDFLVDGFTSMLMSMQGVNNEDYSKRKLQGDDSFDGFFSGLADFKAKFSSDVKHPNPNRPDETHLMALSMAQSTDVKSANRNGTNYERFTQTFNHELEIREHKPLMGLESIDFDKGNYRYEVHQESETQTRTLDRVRGLMSDLSMQETKEDILSSKTYRNSELVEYFTDTQSSFSTVSLAELDQKNESTVKLIADLEKLLDINRQETRSRTDHLAGATGTI
jgi:hypothetical protein